jgi:hypothetical protein
MKNKYPIPHYDTDAIQFHKIADSEYIQAITAARYQDFLAGKKASGLIISIRQSFIQDPPGNADELSSHPDVRIQEGA